EGAAERVLEPLLVDRHSDVERNQHEHETECLRHGRTSLTRPADRPNATARRAPPSRAPDVAPMACAEESTHEQRLDDPGHAGDLRALDARGGRALAVGVRP